MIPKIIHQIWLGPKKPPLRLMNSFRYHNPTWQYYFWSEQNLPSLICQRQFDWADSYPMKADILRYEILYKYGGVYADADFLCLRALDPLIEIEQSFFIGIEHRTKLRKVVANGFMGCERYNAFVGLLISTLAKRQKHECRGGASTKTGPWFITRMIEKFNPPNILIYPKILFYPISQKDFKTTTLRTANLESSFCVHFWAGDYGYNIVKEKL